MNIGDNIYYVNSGREIDTYTVYNIEDDKIYVAADIEPTIKTFFKLQDFKNNNLPRLFTDLDKAEQFKSKLDYEYEMERQRYFDKILEEALNSVTLSTVENHGVLLKEKKTEYDAYYSDAPGGCWYEAKLYLYENKKYIIVYKYSDINDKVTRECIKFCEKQ